MNNYFIFNYLFQILDYLCSLKASSAILSTFWIYKIYKIIQKLIKNQALLELKSHEFLSFKFYFFWKICVKKLERSMLV